MECAGARSVWTKFREALGNWAATSSRLSATRSSELRKRVTRRTSAGSEPADSASARTCRSRARPPAVERSAVGRSAGEHSAVERSAVGRSAGERSAVTRSAGRRPVRVPVDRQALLALGREGGAVTYRLAAFVEGWVPESS